MDNWVTTAQAAALLGVTRRYVNMLIERDVLVAHKISDRVLLIERDSLSNFERKRKKRKSA